MAALAGAHDAQSAAVSAALSRPARSNGPAGPTEPGDPASGGCRPLQATNSPREPGPVGCSARARWVVEGCIPRNSGCVPGCRATGLRVRCCGCVRWCRRSFGLGCWWGPFATAFLGQFGHHTLALECPPPSIGARTRPRRPLTRRAWGRSGGRERSGTHPRTLLRRGCISASLAGCDCRQAVVCGDGA